MFYTGVIIVMGMTNHCTKWSQSSKPSYRWLISIRIAEIFCAMLGIGSEKRGCFTLHNFSQICILYLSYLVTHYTFGSTCIKFMFAMNYGKSETSLFGFGVRFRISYPLLSGTFRSTTRQNRRPELQNVKKQCEFKRLKKPWLMTFKMPVR